MAKRCWGGDAGVLPKPSGSNTRPDRPLNVLWFSALETIFGWCREKGQKSASFGQAHKQKKRKEENCLPCPQGTCDNSDLQQTTITNTIQPHGFIARSYLWEGHCSFQRCLWRPKGLEGNAPLMGTDTAQQTHPS